MYRRNYYGRRAYGRGAYYPTGIGTNLRITGRGSYISDLFNRYKRYIPRLLGGGVGYLAGGPAAATAGYAAGGQFSKNILGWGKYRLGRKITGRGAYGSAISTKPWSKSVKLVSKGQLPQFQATAGAENTVRIVYKEPLGSVLSTTGFGLSTISFNPGLSTFSWLSSFANSFQTYKVNSLALIYTPSVSSSLSSATVASLGIVSLGSEINAYGTAPSTSSQVQQTQFSATGKPSEELVMPIEQSPKAGGRTRTTLLVRSGEVPTGANLQDYDNCVMYIATDTNGAAGVELGRLYVSYDINFYSPAIIRPGDRILYAHYRPTTVSTNNPLGTAWTEVSDTIGLTRTSTTKMTFARGNYGVYRVSLKWIANSAATTVPLSGNFTYSNCSLYEGVDMSESATTHNISAPTAGATSANSCIVFWLQITDPTVESWIDLGNCTWTNVTYCDLLVEQTNPDLE